MRVLVCGGRDFGDIDLLRKVLNEILFDILPDGNKGFPLYDEIKIIAGGARGADSLAEIYAIEEDVPYQIFPADWNKHGLSAGFIRNQQMLDEGHPDLIVAFPGGNGTADMVQRAKAAGIEVREIK